MSYIVLNAVPILLATLAGLAFGFVWTRLFGPGREAGVPSAGFVAAAFVAEAWLAAILAGALILAPQQQGSPWTMAIGSAVVIWIGFVLPALAVTLGRRRVGAGGIAADCAHWLGVMVIQAVVMQAYGVAAPAVGG